MKSSHFHVYRLFLGRPAVWGPRDTQHIYSQTKPRCLFFLSVFASSTAGNGQGGGSQTAIDAIMIFKEGVSNQVNLNLGMTDGSSITGTIRDSWRPKGYTWVFDGGAINNHTHREKSFTNEIYWTQSQFPYFGLWMICQGGFETTSSGNPRWNRNGKIHSMLVAAISRRNKLTGNPRSTRREFAAFPDEAPRYSWSRMLVEHR